MTSKSCCSELIYNQGYLLNDIHTFPNEIIDKYCFCMADPKRWLFDVGGNN